MQLSHCLLSGEKRGDFNQQYFSDKIFVAFFHAAATVFFEN